MTPTAHTRKTNKIQKRREAMVQHQLANRGITDEAVLRAVRRVPRDIFVPQSLVEFAYEDTPLPIEEAQTISQPYIVALMAELMEIEPGDRVLEVGTGSGYAAAVLAEIGAVLGYLEDVDPETAVVARQRYGCLSPWEQDPATYGAAALSGQYEGCEREEVAMLQELLSKRIGYVPPGGTHDRQRFMDAVQNARLVANAEQYYRIMYYGSAKSWKRSKI
jgi:SAM-dependent methyltransferase